VWEGERLELDKAFETPSFKGTLLGEGSLEGDAGVGQGGKPEEGEKEGGGGGKVELDEVKGVVEGEYFALHLCIYALSRIRAQHNLLRTGSSSSNSSSSLSTLPHPKLSLPPHPSFPPLLPDELSSLRQRYLSRLRSMGTYRFGRNHTHNERMLVNLVTCLEEGEVGKGLCFAEVPRVCFPFPSPSSSRQNLPESSLLRPCPLLWKVVVATEFYFTCGLDQ